MKLTVKLESWEIQNVLMEHVRTKFPDLCQREDEYLNIQRVGEPAPDFVCTVEVAYKRPSAWD